MLYCISLTCNLIGPPTSGVRAWYCIYSAPKQALNCIHYSHTTCVCVLSTSPVKGLRSTHPVSEPRLQGSRSQNPTELVPEVGFKHGLYVGNIPYLAFFFKIPFTNNTQLLMYVLPFAIDIFPFITTLVKMRPWYCNVVSLQFNRQFKTLNATA